MDLSKRLLIFDGDCGFCRRFVRVWQRRTSDKINFIASQELKEVPQGVDPADFRTTVLLVEESSSGVHVFKGAEAVFKVLEYGEFSSWPLKAYEKIPGFSAVAEAGYKIVASNRPTFSKISKWFGV